MTPNVACRRVRQSFRMLKINPRSVFSSNAVSSPLSPPSLSSVSTFTFSLSPDPLAAEYVDAEKVPQLARGSLSQEAFQWEETSSGLC